MSKKFCTIFIVYSLYNNGHAFLDTQYIYIGLLDYGYFFITYHNNFHLIY